VIARTTWGRALAVFLSIGVSQLAVPVAHAAPPAPASQHVVDQNQVARRLLESARTREERVALFQAALGTEAARQKARSLGADPDRLRAAVPHLTDRELADLASRAESVERDVMAGHHRGGPPPGLVVLGVLLIVTGIAVLVAVASAYDDDWDDDWDDCYCY
jgi:hypothetical protein